LGAKRYDLPWDNPPLRDRILLEPFLISSSGGNPACPTTNIVRCAIHPAIGIARVGNAPADEYYIAPEIPGQAARPGEGRSYKNAQGQIRREAARFRVYGYNAAGEVVKEITAEEAEITWEVHVANRKAAWYNFLNALDLRQHDDSLAGLLGELVDRVGRSAVYE
jgi:hypothetical protein